jgi:hypothetical protein
MKRAAVPSILVVVVLLAVVVIAEAQQPTRVPRIGYLNDSPLGSFPKIRAEAFRQGLRELVMTQDTDPVRNGFVASLARPGGNITGLSRLAPELSGKQSF